MVKKQKKNVIKTTCTTLGLLIVFGTHIYMLAAGIPQSQLMAHAILNLVAGLLLSYSLFAK